LPGAEAAPGIALFGGYMAKEEWVRLENSIGYTFQDRRLLERAFVHSSADAGESYERLEFLGDAVLELIVSEHLYFEKPDFTEGEMTKSRAALVNENALVRLSRELGLSEYLTLGRGERNSGGADKPSILADVVEALIGAVYVDGGFDAARGMVGRLMEGSFDTVLSGGGVGDYKTRLQEYYHKKGISDIHYVVYKEEGPPHDKVFYVKLIVAGEEISQGKGRSKKTAEQKAARQACLNVKE
jgi:ribonuclease-3